MALVNTCGFVEAAKKDSIDTVLAAADLKDGGRTQAVVAVGCLAERYGEELAEALPEADAVLGFDDYADISARLQAHPRRRARTCRTSRGTAGSCCRWRPRTARPADPPGADASATCPTGWRPPSGPQPLRMRLGDGPVAPLKLASRLRPALHVLRDPDLPRRVRVPPPARRARRGRAGWPSQGVRELVLVSENSTSYGKDLGDLRLLETLLPELAAVDGHRRGSGSATCSPPRCGRAWSR